MKTLVTGGGGFIGAWVVRRLIAAGIQVRVLELGTDNRLLTQILGRTPSDVEWLAGDLSRRADFESAADGCDRIIHLAGALGPLCQTDPARAAEINYVGTLHVFALANKLSVPVVYASTALVHTSSDGETVVPGGHYGIFKLASELSADVYFRENGLSSIGIRPPVVYGFGRTQGNSAGLSLACRAAALGEDYTIAMSGLVEAAYVEDVAAAFVMAATRPPQGAHAVNLIGTRVSIDDFTDATRRIVPQARLSVGGREHAITPVRPGRNLDDLIPAIPRTAIADGIAATIRYHRSGLSPVAA